MRRRLLSFFIKAVISALLLYLSLYRVKLDSVGQRLGEVDFRWVAFMLWMLCIQTPLTALRWSKIAAKCDVTIPVATAVRYSFIGQFFSQVLPSTVSGDAARIWLMARGGAGWPMAIYSVLIDRVVGVSALAVLVVGCLPWTLGLVHDPIARVTLALIGFGTLAAAAAFLAVGVQHLQVMDRWWLTRHLATASRLAWRLCRSAAGMQVAAQSFVIHLVTVIVGWSAAMATHASVDFAQILFLLLPVLLIATIPLSIAGWGVRESAMVLAFSYAGLAGSDGLIVSILFGAANLGIGVIGGVVWVASGYRWRSVKTMEADKLAHGGAA